MMLNRTSLYLFTFAITACTGSNDDGWLLPQVFARWTDQTRLPVGGEVRSPQGVLGGEIYRHLALRGLDAEKLSGDDTHMQLNGIGLHFLSRYLVTFDFPHRTMYLKRPSVWSLIF